MLRSRSLVVGVPALAVAVVSSALIASACTNDFDALFAGDASTVGPDGGTNPPAAPSASAPPAPTGTATPTPPGDGGLACGPPVATCAPPESECKGRTGGDCTNTCAGCGCTCPVFNCNDGASDKCATTCSEGAICNVNCAKGQCTLVSTGGATAALTCGEAATLCRSTCDQGSCETTCNNKTICNVLCGPGTSCLVRCGNKTTACELDCQGGQKRECPNGIITCNRDCPP